MENKSPIKKILTVLLIILFPLGMIYCIGIALFSDKRSFKTFIGIVLIFGIGILLGMYFIDHTVYDAIINWIVKAWEWVKGIFVR